MKTKFLTVGVRCYKLKNSEYCGIGLKLEVSQYELMFLLSMQMVRYKNKCGVYECVFAFLWLCPPRRPRSGYSSTKEHTWRSDLISKHPPVTLPGWGRGAELRLPGEAADSSAA